ncbi:MAG: hypothetical protein K8L99_31965 [Anaerolineae bacterium]|nr:hypothetical protein [Anaerolineae bacterium]
MSNYDTMPEPLPIDYDDWGPPLDDYGYEAALDTDPYPPPDDLSPSVLDGFIPDDYVPEDRGQFPDMPPLSQDGLQGFETPEPADEGWSWHDARLIGVDRGEAAEGGRYEVGAIDLYADADSGDLGGSYLPIAAFSDEVPATAFYHDLQAQIHDAGLASYQVPDFAEGKAFEMNPEPETWRGAEPAEYAAFEYLRDLETFDPALADDPPEEALDPLIQTAIELGGVARAVEPEVEPGPVVDEAAFQALNAIGVQAENFDPNADPPPFYDAETGTAYWIGVFQPDKDDRENCVTSILSLGRNPETGAMEAQLAPCVPGDWDKAYTSAEYLIQVAQKGGIEQVFDTAEGMALATDQREFWETERGVALEPEATREIADFSRETWEVER